MIKGLRCAICEWLGRKLGVPSYEAARKLCRDWEYAQANDDAVFDQEPEQDRLREAFALRETDPEGAFQRLLAHAEAGSVWSMVWVGWLYENGEGVAQDAAQADDWYRRAAEAGSQRALLHHLENLWARGDLDAFEAALGREVAAGWPPALYWLASVRLRRSPSREVLALARPLLERAAAKGCPRAQWKLSRLLSHGSFGLREVPRGLRMTWTFSMAMIDALERRKVEALAPAAATALA